MMTTADLQDATRKVKAEATALGFSHVGIARATHLREEEEHLAEWLQRGFAASMGWIGRRAAERLDPRRVLPEANSIIVLAMNYYSPPAHEPAPGKISRYAWGDDYHDVVSDRVRRLEQWLRTTFPGIGTRWYVDTGPVMEKAWAERAGVGWLGKNGTIITRDMGSWVFLGVILVTEAFAYDEPATDQCGTCTLCLDACPTDAIVEPCVVDSRKCISYLTIEHRGAFAEGDGALLGDWIFGCDICQDVCPWNQKFARETDIPGFAPRDGLVQPDPATMANISDDAFAVQFQRSPVLRARPEGLRRNAQAVLDNGPDTNSADPPRPPGASHP